MIIIWIKSIIYIIIIIGIILINKIFVSIKCIIFNILIILIICMLQDCWSWLALRLYTNLTTGNHSLCLTHPEYPGKISCSPRWLLLNNSIPPVQRLSGCSRRLQARSQWWMTQMWVVNSWALGWSLDMYYVMSRQGFPQLQSLPSPTYEICLHCSAVKV